MQVYLYFQGSNRTSLRISHSKPDRHMLYCSALHQNLKYTIRLSQVNIIKAPGMVAGRVGESADVILGERRGWLTSMAMGAMSILLTQAQECSLKGLQSPLITMRYKSFRNVIGFLCKSYTQSFMCLNAKPYLLIPVMLWNLKLYDAFCST